MSSTKSRREYTTEHVEEICAQLDRIHGLKELLDNLTGFLSKIPVIGSLVYISSPLPAIEFLADLFDWLLPDLKRQVYGIKDKVEQIDLYEAQKLNDDNTFYLQTCLMDALKTYILTFENANLNPDIGKLISSLDQMNDRIKEQAELLDESLMDVYVTNAIIERNKAIRDLGKDLIKTPLNIALVVFLCLSGDYKDVPAAFADAVNSDQDLIYSAYALYHSNQAIDEAKNGNYTMADVDTGLSDMYNDLHSVQDDLFMRAKWGIYNLKELEDKYKLLGVLTDEEKEEYYKEYNKLRRQVIVSLIEGLVAYGVDGLMSLIGLYGSINGLTSAETEEAASKIMEMLQDPQTILESLEAFYNTIFNSDNPSEIISNLIDAILSLFGISDDSDTAKKIVDLIKDGKSANETIVLQSPQSTNLSLNSLSAQNTLENISTNLNLNSLSDQNTLENINQNVNLSSPTGVSLELDPIETLSKISSIYSSWSTPWTHPYPPMDTDLLSLINSDLFTEKAQTEEAIETAL